MRSGGQEGRGIVIPLLFLLLPLLIPNPIEVEGRGALSISGAVTVLNGISGVAYFGPDDIDPMIARSDKKATGTKSFCYTGPKHVVSQIKLSFSDPLSN